VRRAILAGPILAALVGCATPTIGVAPEMTWRLTQDPQEGAKLVLGVPDTDDLRLILTCRAHGGEIEATFFGRLGDPAAVELRSGDVAQVYAGAGQADEESVGALDIGFKLNTADPVMARLADTGELTIVLPTRRIVLPNAFSQAHDFLALCRPQV